jgi:hypothetical protein
VENAVLKKRVFDEGLLPHALVIAGIVEVLAQRHAVAEADEINTKLLQLINPRGNYRGGFKGIVIA